MYPIARSLYYQPILHHKFRPLDRISFEKYCGFCVSTKHLPKALVHFPSEPKIFEHLSKHPCTKNLETRINEEVAYHFHNLRILGKDIPSEVERVLIRSFLPVTPHVALAMQDNLAKPTDKDEYHHFVSTQALRRLYQV